jgi:hypothetical protein
MSYDEDELVGVVGAEEEEDDEETEEDLFAEDAPLAEDFLDDEDEEDKVPEGFLDDEEE